MSSPTTSHWTTLSQVFTGFVFTVNFVMGTGGLALPLALARAGYALGTLVVAFAAACACITLGWQFEAQCRAYALSIAFDEGVIDVRDDDDDNGALATVSCSVNTAAAGERGVLLPAVTATKPTSAAVRETLPHHQLVDRVAFLYGEHHHFHFTRVANGDGATYTPPDWEVELHGDAYFEVGDVLRLFCGRYAVWFWNVCLLCYVVTTLWVYLVVLCETLLLGVPLVGVTTYRECHPFARQDGSYAQLPDNCAVALRVYLAIGAVMLLLLCARDWKAMPYVQKVLTVLMYTIFGAMSVTSLVGMGSRPFCIDGDPNRVPPSNCTTPGPAPEAPFTKHLPAADAGHFSKLFAIGVFAMVCHTGSTFILRKVARPSLAKATFRLAYGVVFVVYVFVAMSLAFYSGTDTASLATTSWAYYKEWGPQQRAPGFVNFVGVVVLLFPAVSVCAGYVLVLRSCTDALEFIIPVEWRISFCRKLGREYLPFNAPTASSTTTPVQVVLRVSLWAASVVLAFASTRFEVAVAVVSLFGFVVLFAIPILVQLGSKRTLSRLGLPTATPYDDIFSSNICAVLAIVVFVAGIIYYIVTGLVPTL